jgi:hypothetical protein
MTGSTDPMGDWDDARLATAFRARFDTPPPTFLASQVRQRLEGIRPGTGAAFARPRLVLRLAAVPIVVVAVALLVVAGALIGAPTPSPATSAISTTQPTGVPTPEPTPGVALFDPAGPPPPTTIRVPGSNEDQPVLTVTQASQRPAGAPADAELVVGGWYALTPVPCAAIPDPTSELENCAVDFTWLMQDGQIVSAGARPTGAAVNIVTALTDWTPPPPNATIAIVVMGHFDDRRADACPAGDRQVRCRGLFVVDAPLWTSAGFIEVGVAPDAVMGLHVQPIEDALRVRDSGSSDEIAVAGWYNAPEPSNDCYAPSPVVRWLSGTCEGARQFLMTDAEILEVVDVTSPTDTTVTLNTPSSPAFQVAFPGTSWLVANGIPDRGSRIPIPVVYVGHFNDRRSAFCVPLDSADPDAAQAACRARFVVDLIAWANGTAREPAMRDYRFDESVPFPDVNVNEVATHVAPTGVVLNATLMDGGGGFGLSDFEPRVVANQPELASAGSIWVVTLLLPRTVCDSFACAPDDSRSSSVALVIGPDGTVYGDLGVREVTIDPGGTFPIGPRL